MAAPIFSWETDTEGWGAGAPNSVATSTIGATDGAQSLAVTQPNDGGHMWWNAATSISLSPAQMQSIFTDATELKLDALFPNPGYNSWFAGHHVEVIIQGSKVGWTGLASREVAVGGAAPQTLTFPLTVAQAADMATSEWGQIVLRFDYGNGGSTSSTATFHVDNFVNTVVVVPRPTPSLYWKGDVDDLWTSLNWTSDLAGTVPGGALLADGTAGIAFASDGSFNSNTVLGANQNVSSIVVTPAVSASISGTHSLTVGAEGIWIDETALGLTIDTSGEVVLDSSQFWRNKSSSPFIVNSVVSGSGTLKKSGPGPLRLGGANSYTGGTLIEHGVLALDNANGLGGATASLDITGGSLDLNGLNVTLGALSGLPGGVINNTSLTPVTLTLDVETDNTYACQINDATGGAPVSLVKKGGGAVNSNGGATFTGPVTIEDGLFVASVGGNVPTWSSLGNSQVAGRTITVTYPGALSFTTNNIFGNVAANPSLLPEVFLNEATLVSSRYNQLGDITFNAASLDESSTDTGTYLGYQFKGRIKVIGSSSSNIVSGSGKGNHLSSNTEFDVANVTGDAAEDLFVSAPLNDQSGDFGSAPGGLTKTGAGTMILSGWNTYTGNTVVSQGTLAVDLSLLSDTGTIEVAAGATLQLNFMEVDTVGSLILGGVPMTEPGTYGGTGSGADFTSPLITGDGWLQIISDPFSQWMTNYPTLVGPDALRGADPDLDGLTNLQEFAFNSEPDDGAPSGKMNSAVATVEAGQALVLTLPVRDGASFSNGTPAVGTVAAEQFDYQINGSNDLSVFDQAVSEVTPALSTGLPELDGGWSYRTFRLDGDVGGATPRGPKGFLRATVVDHAP